MAGWTTSMKLAGGFTGPALFRIMDLAEFALETIGNLTDPGCRPRLRVG